MNTYLLSLLLTLTSRHIGVDTDHYNEVNFGITHQVDNKFIGVYKNSLNNISFYFGKTIRHNNNGIDYGLATGYKPVMPVFYFFQNIGYIRLIFSPIVTDNVRGIIGLQMRLE